MSCPKDARSISVVKKASFFCTSSSFIYILKSQLLVIVNKIVASPQYCQHFKKCTRKHYHGVSMSKGVKLETLMVIRDVVTCKNYTHAMIKQVFMLHNTTMVKTPLRIDADWLNLRRTSDQIMEAKIFSDEEFIG
jgi:hypothetical protein